MTQINEPPLDLKLAVGTLRHGSTLAPEPPITAIRGMCRGINTDVPPALGFTGRSRTTTARGRIS